jgi:hypothetical protein
MYQFRLSIRSRARNIACAQYSETQYRSALPPQQGKEQQELSSSIVISFSILKWVF